jgi:hypothetical protein
MSDHRSSGDELAELVLAANALSQTAHRAGESYDVSAARDEMAPQVAKGARATRYQLSWELHRAGEMLRQVAQSIEHARVLEASLHPEMPPASTTRPLVAHPGAGLGL